jgi:hypothetical protein
MIQNAIQFIHVDAHAIRKGSKRQSVDGVINEAARIDGFCQHIERPRPPIITVGLSLEELRRRHNRTASKARLTTTKGVCRKIRDDQLTMLSCVSSCPITPRQAQEDCEAGEAVKLWHNLTVKFLLDKFGAQVKTILVHIDEPYVHLHAFILLDCPSMAAATIHPGLHAKSEMQNLLLAQNISRADSNRAGNHAYCDAMRSFQDDYAVRVGIPCGQSRVGPKRMRWTRAEWHARQSDAKLLAEKEKCLREREQLLKERENLLEKKENSIENHEEPFDANPSQKD